LAVRISLAKDEPLEKALKRLKKICDNKGMLGKMRHATYYEKPSDQRRKAEKKRLKNIKQAERLRGLAR
jgi:small subunit ribosomal protein S21